MKVILDDMDHLRQVSKEIDLPRVNAESVGLVGVFGDRYRRAFTNKVINMLKHKENMHRFWLHIFNQLVDDGLTVLTHEIPRDAWAEVDFHPDIDTIRNEIADNLKQAADLQENGKE